MLLLVGAIINLLVGEIFLPLIIFCVPQLRTLRGTILEDSIPTGAKTGTSKGIPPRDIVEYISQGELQMSCLKLGRSDKKVRKRWRSRIMTRTVKPVCGDHWEVVSVHWL